MKNEEKHHAVMTLYKSGIIKAEIARRIGISRERVAQIIGKHPEQEKRHTVRQILRKAIKSGAVSKYPCSVCGNPKSQAHHEDYDKPLDVIWLCRKHHQEKHIHIRDPKETLKANRIKLAAHRLQIKKLFENNPPTSDYDSRRADIQMLRKPPYSWTLQMIGDKYGISKARVSKILGRTSRY